MSRRPRKNHSPAFKARVALEAAKEEQTTVAPFRQLLMAPYVSGNLFLLEKMAKPTYYGYDERTDSFERKSFLKPLNTHTSGI